VTSGIDARARQRDIEGCHHAHARLLETVAGVDDGRAQAASVLPGWSVGHVLTHLARNADGLAGVLEGALRGEVVPMYLSVEARNADIEAGSGRPAAELAADLVAAAARIERAFADATDEVWASSTTLITGPSPMDDLPARRWREVEVHHADLGLAFTPGQWSDAYVRRELPRMQMLWASRRPMGLTELPEAALRVNPHDRLAWLLGRGTIVGLEPAGIF
jgi:maleylpyruvate isomerase